MQRTIPAITIVITLFGLSLLVHGQSVEEVDSAVPDRKLESEPSAAQADVSNVSRLILKDTNGFRKKHDLGPVDQVDELASTAKYFADYMARTGKYGHQADGNKPSQRAKEHGYEFCIVLENIAYAYRSTGFEGEPLANQFMKGWKNSEGHRENMLDPDVTEIGVAVSVDANGQYFAVQMFGRPESEAIRFEVTNRSGQEVAYLVNRKNSDRRFPLPPRTTRTHTMCRPTSIDLAWTDDDEKLAVSDGKTFVVTDGNAEHPTVEVSAD